MSKSSKFSLILRKYRQNAKLTQKQMADALNIERSTYAYYETGVSHPSSKKIIEIARILNVPYSTFMDAVIDNYLDNEELDEKSMILRDDSWLEREKMYSLPKHEQTLLLEFRALSLEQKKQIIDIMMKMKKQNREKQNSNNDS